MGASPRPAQQQHQQQQHLLSYSSPVGTWGDYTHTRNRLFDLSTLFPTASLSSSSWQIPVGLWYLLAVSMLLNLLLAFQCLRLSSSLSSSLAACSLLTDPQLNPSLGGDPIPSLLSDAAVSNAAVPGFALARYSGVGAGAAGGSAAGIGGGGGGGGSGCHPLPWVRRYGVGGESGGSSSSSGIGGGSGGGVTWSLWPFSLLWNGQPATQTGHARSGSSGSGGGSGTLHAHGDDDDDDDEMLMQKCYGIELERAEKIFQWHTERVMDHSHVAEIASLPPPNAVENHWLLTRGESTRPMLEFELLPRYPCPAEIRIGAWGEGGKWLCMTPFEVQVKKKEDIVVYSIGSIGETSFEQHIHDLLGAKAHTFDPTLPDGTRTATSDLPYLHFHNIGLTGSSGAPATGLLRGFRQDEEGEPAVAEEDLMQAGDPMQAVEPRAFPAGGPELKDIAEIMRMLNHTFVDVFKIDCEGCEIGWAEGLPKHMTRDKPLFGQILVEMHRVQEPSDFLALSTLRRLGYRGFHLEHNYYDPAGVVEAAFIHESLVAPRSDG